MANYLIFNQDGSGLGDTEKIVVNRDHVKYVSYIAANQLGLKLNSGSLITIQLSGNEAPAVIDNINDALKANPSGKDLEVKLPAGITISSSSSIVQPSAGPTSLFDLDDASKNNNGSFQIGSTSTALIPDAISSNGSNLFIQNNAYGSGIENYQSSSTVAIGDLAGGTGSPTPTTIQSQFNTCIGASALYTLGNSPSYVPGPFNFLENNVALGTGAGFSLTEGKANTFLGTYAGFSYNQGTANSNGNVTIIGYSAAASSATATNEITLGNSSVATLRCAVTSITSLSDERDKKDITDLAYGLDFVESLQPKQFTWNNRPETTIEIDKDGNQIEKETESANKGKKDFGFIAQDVQPLDNDVLRLVYDENPDKLEMSYGKLVPILVKAVKELSDKVKALEAK